MISELVSDLKYRLRALFRRDDIERELAAELRSHLEHEAEKYQKAGLTRDEAFRRARLGFGGVDRAAEASRDARGTIFVDTTIQDLRYAVRGLRAKPVFTIGVMLTLGLGIGANAAMFGIVDRMLLRPPTYLRAPNDIHRVYQMRSMKGTEQVQGGTRFPRYVDLERLTHSFSAIVAFSTGDVAVGDGDNARERMVTAASGNFFDQFDMQPALGRFFTREDDRAPMGSPVVVLGYEYWQSQFAGRADVIGQRVRVGRTMCTVIGVAPARFAGVGSGSVPAMYMPITMRAWDQRGSDVKPNYDYTKDYGWFWIELFARRRPGVTVASANADLTTALLQSWHSQADDAAIARQRPRAELRPIQFERGPEAGPEAHVVLWVTGVTVFVLLIACANVASLLLARSVSRRREIALRLALGVSRTRLLRQLLTESLVLAMLGGIVGLAIAASGGGILRAVFLPDDAHASVLTDIRTLTLAFVATAMAALLTGVAPAVQALRYQLSQTLNGSGRDAGAHRSAVRAGLLVVQATLSVVLLVGAGLFVRSLHNVRSTHLGFDVDPVIVVGDNMRGAKITGIEQSALEQRLVDAAQAIPGVVSATQSPSVPFWGYEGREISVPGVDSVDALGDFYLQAGNVDFFKTYGARIVRGRGFDMTDGPRSARVIVVSDGMAKTLWPDGDPIGKCVRIDAEARHGKEGDDRTQCSTVIGVSEEMRIHSFGAARDGRSKDAREFSYTLPISQYSDGPAGTLVVRVAGNGTDYADIVRRSLQAVMPGSAYVTVMPLRSVVDLKMESWRTGATMFVAFGALAVVLAGIGLYSVIAYAVAQRRQEIGVRIALGASVAHVVQLVVGSGLRLVAIGLALGCGAALFAGHWVDSLLFKESSRDPIVYAAVAVVLVAVALVATFVPALGASRVNPNVTLRAD